jgi:hypothetical protein
VIVFLISKNEKSFQLLIDRASLSEKLAKHAVIGHFMNWKLVNFHHVF